MPLTLEETLSLPDVNLLGLGLSEDEIKAIRLYRAPAAVQDVQPLRGHDMPWREWVPKEYLRRDCGPFADFHVRAWEWFDGLELDKKSESALLPWSRGLGKSTTLEGGIIRTCVKGSRRFWLYVSRTLDDANNHVMAIARVLERMGIDRQVNKYGLAVGWNAQRLRTASGFSILSFGLDAGARGIKLDDIRPDGIALDDIDHLGDSPEMVEKKCRIITNTIMQAGSPSFATIFVQNPIGPHTVMSRTLDGRLGIMSDRNMELAKLIPAVYDLEYELYYSDDGRELAKITGGRSSWEGKTLEDWQYQIDKGTIDGFLIECQHLITMGATFFDKFNEAEHMQVPDYTPGELPSYFRVFGGFDWGYADLSAFTLACVDTDGVLHVLESWEINRESNDALADKIIATLNLWGIKKKDCEIFADGSMWAQKTFNGVKAPADVENFFAKGLEMIRCAQGRDANKFRNNAITTYLAGDGLIKFYKGRNTRLNECIKNAEPSRTDVTQVLHNIYSHLISALGHMLSARPTPSKNPKPILSPDEKKAESQKDYEETNRLAEEARLIERNKSQGLAPKRDDKGELMRDDKGFLQWVQGKKAR